MLIHSIGLYVPTVCGLIVPFQRTHACAGHYAAIRSARPGDFRVGIRGHSKVTPFSVRKEIEEDHNIALAIVIASVIFGSALIIAAAIHG